jgi:hypothetical protein
VGLDDQAVEILWIGLNVATFLRQVIERLAHRCCVPDQGSVREHLDRAQAEPAVTKARADPQVEAEADVVVMVRCHRMEDVGSNHHLNADGKPVCIERGLVGREFDGAPADPAAADARLHTAADSFGEVRLAGSLDRIHQFSDRVGGHECAGKRLSALLQQTRGSCVHVDRDDPPGNLGDLAVETELGQDR